MRFQINNLLAAAQFPPERPPPTLGRRQLSSKGSVL